MADLGKTKTQLVSELELLRKRLAEFEAKTSDEALQESEANYRDLVETSQDLIYRLDDEGRFTYINPAWKETLGYDSEEMLGRPFTDFKKEEEAARAIVVHKEILAGGKVTNYETAYISKSGQEITLNFRAKPNYDSLGKIVGTQGTAQDITRRRRAEEALRESEARYSRAVAGTNDGIWDWNIETGEDYLSLRWLAILGYEEGDLAPVAESTFNLIHPDDKELGQAALEAHFVERAVYDVEFRMRCKNGEYLWVRSRGLADRNEEGKPVRMAGSISDISDRKQAEEDRRDSQRLLQTVFDTIPHSVFVRDTSGNFVMVNQTMAARNGLDAQNFLDSDIWKIAPELILNRADYLTRDRMVFKTRKTIVGEEVAVVLPDGSRRFQRATKAPLLNEAGDVVGVVGISEDVTERLQAEEKLRLSEERFRSVFDNSPSLIALKDLEGRFLFANKSYAEFVGLPPEKIVGQTSFDVHAEKFAQSFVSQDREILETGNVIENELEWKEPDGSARNFVDIKFPVLGSDGKINGVGIISTDVTGLKLVEKQLRASQRLLQTVFDTIPIGIHVKDTSGRYTLVNRWMTNFFGRSPTEFVGKNWSQLGFGTMEQQQQSEEDDRRVLERGEMVEVPESLVQLADGKTIWRRRIIAPLRDEAGEMVGLLGVSEDITERKLAEDELRESEEKFRTLLDHTPSAIFLKGLDGRFQLVNRGFLLMYGFSEKDVIGKTSDDLFPAGSGNVYRKQDRKVLETGQLSEEEFDVPLAGGGKRTVISTKFPVLDGNGQIAGVGTIATDITEQRIIERQLRESQKMEALGTLAGGIAHDFNNILQPIIGFSNILMTNHDPKSEEYKFLATISRAAFRAKNLVSQIMLFSRRGQTQKDISDLGAVTQDVIRFIRSTLPKGITIEENIASNIAPVFCDSSQIYQVLLNLCINAGHAMGDAGVLTINFEPVELEETQTFAGNTLSGIHVRLAVSDTGVGMDSEIMEHIFDPFFTTKEIGSGTGLGLSSAFGIIQDHQGGIRVTSEPGKGSTFEIFLPVSEQKIAESRAVDPMVPMGTGEILFVDDEEVITDLSKITLAHYGYNVTTATGSQEALQVFKANPDRFDLVITDQGMPDMSGDQLVAEIRKVRKNVPIILCTGFSETMTPEISEAIGVSAFLYKPIDPRDLGRVVHDILGSE